MLEKQTLRKILDFCGGPYDFMLIENIPCEHRSCMNLWHFYGWRFLRGGALCHVAPPEWRFVPRGASRLALSGPPYVALSA